MTKPEKALWLLFLLILPVALGGSVNLFGGHWFDVFMTYVPLAAIIFFACWALNIKRGVGFILLAGSLGFLAEAVSLNYGTLFGGEYKYKSGATLLKVPVAVIAYWAIFIFIAYWLVNTFLYWRNKDVPKEGHDKVWRIVPLVIADGLAVAAIDLIMDPVQVKAGAWSWINGGPYFGVPVGNFVGWFCVAVSVTTIFRLFEFYHPQKKLKLNTPTYILPVLTFLLIGSVFLLEAQKYGLSLLIAIGLIIIVIPALLNLYLYSQYKNPN